MPRVLLPIGISFFTFHAISYVVDVYRRDATAQKSPVHAALYLLLFPQLIAGPIIRYRDIADQLARRLGRRSTTSPAASAASSSASAKKVLIANVVAGPADKIFAMPVAELSPAHAWLGIVCYTLQIYFDFSGYSDMAIGLGRMFGFRFPGELPLAVHRRQRSGVLAPLAHLAVDLVPRLPLHPARRQPRQPGAPVPQSDHGVLPVRPVARRELELRHLGPVARRVPGRRARRSSNREHAEHAEQRPHPRICSPRYTGVSPGRSGLTLYTLLVVMIGWVFFRAETLPARDRVPEGDGGLRRRGADAVHGAVVPDAGTVAGARRRRDRLDAVGPGARADGLRAPSRAPSTGAVSPR